MYLGNYKNLVIMSFDFIKFCFLNVKWRKLYCIIEFLINYVCFSFNDIKKGSYMG